MLWSQVAQELLGRVTSDLGLAILAAFMLIAGSRDAFNLVPVAIFASSALLAWWLLGDWSLPLVAAASLSVLTGGLLGIVVSRLARGTLGRPFDSSSAVVAAIAAGAALAGLARGRSGPLRHASALPALTLPWPYIDRLSPSAQHGLALAALVLLLFVARWLFGRTHLGRAARAIAADRQAACLLGIPVERTIATTFFLAAAMGTAAGILAVLSLDAEL